MAAPHIDSATGGLLVEVVAALTILTYLIYARYYAHQDHKIEGQGVTYSILTGICVGAGTVFFFALFQKGAPLTAVPAILAGGAAIMAVVGFIGLHEEVTASKLVGLVLSIIAIFLLQRK